MASGTQTPKPVDPARASPRALVTGLKILEHLAQGGTRATPSALAADLRLSVPTVKRALLVLEQRGYLAPAGQDGAYVTTRQPGFAQGAARPRQRLLDHARSVMRTLADTISQSCNLAVPSGADMLVVAQEDSPAPFGIRVPEGFRYDIPASAPGLVFAAFMENSDPARWPEGLSEAGDRQAWTSLRQAVQKAAEAGFVQAANPHFPDITDLSCPIVANGRFIAVLTVPFIKTSRGPNLTWCLAHVQQAAEQLNARLRSDALVC